MSRPAWHAKMVSGGAPGAKKRARHGDKKPKAAVRGRLLEQFDERCAFCDHKFGGVQKRDDGSAVITLIVWDHLVPWSYLMHSPDANWLPACPVCNGIKRDLMFASLAKAREYVQKRRLQKGWTAHAEFRPESEEAA